MQIGRPLTPAERHELVVDTAVPRATVRAAVKAARAAQRMADATEAAQGIYAAQVRDQPVPAASMHCPPTQWPHNNGPTTWTMTRHDGPNQQWP